MGLRWSEAILARQSAIPHFVHSERFGVVKWSLSGAFGTLRSAYNYAETGSESAMTQTIPRQTAAALIEHIAGSLGTLFDLRQSGPTAYANETGTTRLTATPEVLTLSRSHFTDAGLIAWSLSIRPSVKLHLKGPTVEDGFDPVTILLSRFHGNPPLESDIARLAVADEFCAGAIRDALQLGYHGSGSVDDSVRRAIDAEIERVQDGYVPPGCDATTLEYLHMILTNRTGG